MNVFLSFFFQLVKQLLIGIGKNVYVISARIDRFMNVIDCSLLSFFDFCQQFSSLVV